MAKGSKSCEPSEIWWGSNPFGQSVEVETTSEYKKFVAHRRALINEHKEANKDLRAHEKILRDKERMNNGYKPTIHGLVKLVKYDEY